jgi:hypothetical protein
MPVLGTLRAQLKYSRDAGRKKPRTQSFESRLTPKPADGADPILLSMRGDISISVRLIREARR